MSVDPLVGSFVHVVVCGGSVAQTRSQVFWSSLGKVELDLTTVSKHILKALERLQAPSAAQQNPKNFPIRGGVGPVFRPRLPANIAVEFSVQKCNLVLSAYELQPTRSSSSTGGVSRVRPHALVDWFFGWLVGPCCWAGCEGRSLPWYLRCFWCPPR